MLAHHRKSVSLSIVSTDLPVWSTLETAATLYQKDQERFHLLLTEPKVMETATAAPSSIFDLPQTEIEGPQPGQQTPQPDAVYSPSPEINTPRLLWLEISPYRVIMTMQGNGKYSYRHFWEQGVYGLSRYWLQGESSTQVSHIRLRNFTRHLWLQRNTLPQHLRLEYELWSDKVPLGNYVLNLEIAP